MAGLTPGYIFTENERVSVAKLHAIVESGSLNNVAQSDLVSGVRLANLTTPGSATTGDLLVGSDYLLDLYESAAWTDFPDDTISITLQNDDIVTGLAGEAVRMRYGTSTSFQCMTSTDYERPLGVLAANISSGASGLVYIRGVVPVRVYGTWEVGDVLIHDTSKVGRAQRAVAATTYSYSNVFARMLDSGGSAGVVTLGTAYLGK